MAPEFWRASWYSQTVEVECRPLGAQEAHQNTNNKCHFMSSLQHLSDRQEYGLAAKSEGFHIKEARV